MYYALRTLQIGGLRVQAGAPIPDAMDWSEEMLWAHLIQRAIQWRDPERGTFPFRRQRVQLQVVSREQGAKALTDRINEAKAAAEPIKQPMSDAARTPWDEAATRRAAEHRDTIPQPKVEHPVSDAAKSTAEEELIRKGEASAADALEHGEKHKTRIKK